MHIYLLVSCQDSLFGISSILCMHCCWFQAQLAMSARHVGHGSEPTQPFGQTLEWQLVVGLVWMSDSQCVYPVCIVVNTLCLQLVA